MLKHLFAFVVAAAAFSSMDLLSTSFWRGVALPLTGGGAVLYELLLLLGVAVRLGISVGPGEGDGGGFDFDGSDGAGDGGGD
jgi:hypothetical protein